MVGPILFCRENVAVEGKDEEEKEDENTEMLWVEIVGITKEEEEEETMVRQMTFLVVGFPSLTIAWGIPEIVFDKRHECEDRDVVPSYRGESRMKISTCN